MGFVDTTRFAMTPKTPEKGGQSPPQTTSAVKMRSNRSKPAKGKNATSSTESEFPPSLTPDQSSTVKITSHTAFAGATFHASPAPSALPMPSFFAKPAASSPAPRDSSNVVQQPSPPATDTEVATPRHPSTMPKSSESPLDFMFRAHRQEKERQRLGTPGNNATQSFSSLDPNTVPKAASMPHSRPAPMRTVSSGAMDSEEFDGALGLPLGPSFATPYQERLKAARSGTSRPVQSQTQPAAKQSDDPTEALKKFLFSGKPQPTAPTPQSHPVQHELQGSTTQIASPPFPGNGQQGPSLQAMENDLRRILKLDAGATTTNTDRRLFTQ
jgi:hypothetical protein